MAGERQYSRVDRVNEALREVIADELERIDDTRLELVTVTGVTTNRDFRHADVWFGALGREDEVAATLGQHRARLQGAVGRQLRLKWTPELAFRPDPAIALGTRVEEILRGLHGEPAGAPQAEDGAT